MPIKDVIQELRQRRASYRAIEEFLAKHGLAAGRTTIAEFCHQVLGESTRSHRRTPRRKISNASTVPEGRPSLSVAIPLPASPSTAMDSRAPRPRGPRVAQIRKLNPQTNETIDSNP